MTWWFERRLSLSLSRISLLFIICFDLPWLTHLQSAGELLPRRPISKNFLDLIRIIAGLWATPVIKRFETVAVFFFFFFFFFFSAFFHLIWNFFFSLFYFVFLSFFFFSEPVKLDRSFDSFHDESSNSRRLWPNDRMFRRLSLAPSSCLPARQEHHLRINLSK